MEVRTFRGEQRNLKVTYAADIAVAGRLLTRR
jgi:2-C-methyl-D-erythritol 4-phosphate cytidylyltransferase